LIPRKSVPSIVLVLAVLSLLPTPVVGELPMIEVDFELDLESMTVDWPSPRLEQFQQRSDEDLLALMIDHFGVWNLEKAVPGSGEQIEARWRIKGRLYEGGPKQALLRLELWQPAPLSESGRTRKAKLTFECELWGPLRNEFDRKMAGQWKTIAEDLKVGFGQLLGCIDGPTVRCDSIRWKTGKDAECDSAADLIMGELKTIPVAEASWWDEENYPLSVIMVPISSEVLGPAAVLRLQCPGNAACTDLLAKALGPTSDLKLTMTKPTAVRWLSEPFCIRGGVAEVGTKKVQVDVTLSPLTPVYYFESEDSELRPACRAAGGVR